MPKRARSSSTGRRQPSDLGIRVKRAREDRDWTQTELANRANIPISYVSKLESGGIQAPAGDYVGKLANALGTSADRLLYGDPLAPDPALTIAIRDALGTEKAHLIDAAVEALRELPPAERDKAIEVMHVIATNWPAGRR